MTRHPWKTDGISKEYEIILFGFDKMKIMCMHAKYVLGSKNR